MADCGRLVSLYLADSNMSGESRGAGEHGVGGVRFHIAVNDVCVWTRKKRQFLKLRSNFMADGATRPSGYCVEHRACSPLCAARI
jgi:hypothetical protein